MKDIYFIKNIFLLFIFISINTLFTKNVVASTYKIAFCRDYSDEKTAYWFNSRYRYEWELNYQFCIQNSNALIKAYEFSKLSWIEQFRIKEKEKREALEKKREALEKKRYRALQEKRRLERVENNRIVQEKNKDAYYIRQYKKFKTYEDICLNKPPLSPSYDFDFITYKNLKRKYNWDLIRKTYNIK